MRILTIAAVLVSTLFAAGSSCVSTQVHLSKEGIKTTAIAIRGCNNPSLTIARVETPGKPDITYASAGPDLCNTVAAAALGAAGQVVASSVLPGSTINVSSGSVNETTTTVDIR